MAQTILSVAEKLALITWNEAYFVSGVSEQSESLKNKIRLMRSALVDASEKRRNNKEAEEWLNQVRDAVMEAEDVIDLFIFRAQRQRQRGIATRYICYPSLLFNRHMLGNRIEISNKKIEHLSDKRSTLGLVTAEAGQSSNEQPGLVLPFHRRDEQGLPFRGRDSVEEFAVIGFQKEEKEVIAKLMAHKKSTPPFPSVVSIVGMGGSGKTTLARKVFKNPHVVQHFSTRAWVSVSQQFVAKEILRAITDQIHPLSSDEKKKVEEEKKELDEGSLISRLSSFLKDKTYLIVFDDLWRPEHWEKLKQTLPVQQQNYQSSKVLFTTRNEDVATYADPFVDIYYQPLLTEDESWKLFLAKVMLESKDDAAGGPTLQHDLVELGRKIVGKCRGLPLAIVLLGGLLSRRPKSHAAWSKVHASVNSALNANEAGISCKQVLGLSYTDLPDQLKPCFLYVGVFPEDYEIECSRLIRLWVAEGFIQPRDQLTMEDVAEEYLEELTKRSMIQITFRNYGGRAFWCRIHDLVRDLAISEAKQERFLQVLVAGSSDDDSLRSSSSLNRSCRRLSITRGESKRFSTSNALNEGTRENYLHSFLSFSSIFSTDEVETT